MTRPLSTMRTAEDDRRAAEASLQDALVDALGEQAGQVEPRTGAATLLGGVSQYVLRKAPCPVLLVPEAGPSS